MFYLSINVKNIGIPYDRMSVYLPNLRLRVIEQGKEDRPFDVDSEGNCFAIETKLNGIKGRLILNLVQRSGYLRFPDEASSLSIKDQSVDSKDPNLIKQAIPFLQIFLDVIARLIEKNNDQKSLAETKLLPAIKK